MSYTIGYDIGTTSIKAVIIDTNGLIQGSAINEYMLITPKPGWAEQNPEDWWLAFINVTKELLLKTGIGSKDICALGLSGQQHGSVFIDKNGEVIRPAILWCDQRTYKQCKKINQIFGFNQFIKLAYNKALPGFTAPKVLWLREEEPNNFKKVYKILLPKDYIRYKLSGNFATDVSDASGTLFLDIAKRNWSIEILEGLNINIAMLPEVFESSDITSTLSKEAADLIGLQQGTPIVAGAGDQAAGAVGCGIVIEGLISDYIGTSGVVSTIYSKPLYDPSGRLHTFCHAIKGKWHILGVTLAAGGSFKWYNEVFGPGENFKKKFPCTEGYRLLDMQAEKTEAGSNGLIFLPYISGERAPHGDPFARGVFFGISYIHKRGHFVRSIMEGVAFSQLDCFNLMKELGITSNKIVLFGGGAKSEIWRYILADVFGVEVITLNIAEGPSYGSAILAGVGVGVFKSVEDITIKIVREKYRAIPNLKNLEKYKNLYKIYRLLYKSLKNEFKKLSVAIN